LELRLKETHAVYLAVNNLNQIERK